MWDLLINTPKSNVRIRQPISVSLFEHPPGLYGSEGVVQQPVRPPSIFGPTIDSNPTVHPY